jgi:hypothetical protein
MPNKANFINRNSWNRTETVKIDKIRRPHGKHPKSKKLHGEVIKHGKDNNDC